MAKISSGKNSKVISSGKGNFAKGGSGHMFGKQAAGPKAPGVTEKAQSGDGGKFMKGGKGHMYGKQAASPRKSGVTGK